MKSLHYTDQHWGIDPKNLCDRHLLLEFQFSLDFVSLVSHGKDVSRYIEEGRVDPSNIQSRFSRIADEMRERGFLRMKRELSLPDSPIFGIKKKISVDKTNAVLFGECKECKRLNT